MLRITTKVSEIVESHLEGRLRISVSPILLFQWLLPSTFDIHFTTDLHNYFNYCTMRFPDSARVLLHQPAFEKLTSRIPKYIQAKRHD